MADRQVSRADQPADEVTHFGSSNSAGQRCITTLAAVLLSLTTASTASNL
jgi:hypothetical protein